MKKLIYTLLVIMSIVPIFTSTVFANNKQTATIAEDNVSIDGKEIEIQGFNVSNNNYFQLRDIAKGLSGTSSQFDVAWNSEKNIIEITTQQPYTDLSIGTTRLTGNGSISKSDKFYGTLKDTKFLVDGKEHILPIFNFAQTNYFKLRDLSQITGFNVSWDNETKQILLSSKLLENTYKDERTVSDKDNSVRPVFPRWKETVSSYITANQDGTISVVEADKNVTIDTYNSSYNLINSKNIEYELPIFGGFYQGKHYNYIAFGQNNKEEDNNKEVIRIVRYDKSLKRIDSVSIKGGESYTTEPFSAAAGRMAENEDKLVFHTSRERYTTKDGLNHQSQLTIIVDTTNMKIINDLGRFQSNHVSHSFDQYVLFDERNHVLVDHGDAYPRSVLLSKSNGDKYEKVNLFNIPGQTGANTTGVSIGGLESSSTNYIVAMNTIDHSLVTEYTSFEMKGLERDQRDIVISTVPKNDLSSNSVNQITLKKYTSTNKNGSIPKLVKISDEQFMVLWQEYNDFNKEGDLKYVLINGQGNPLGEIKTIKSFRLSQAQPIVINNNIFWYVNKGIRTFYTIPL